MEETFEGPMVVHAWEIEGTLVISFPGEKIEIKREFEAFLRQVLWNDIAGNILTKWSIERIILNFEGVTFIDSAGIGILFETMRLSAMEVKGIENKIRSCCFKPEVEKLARLVSFHYKAAIFPTEKEAFESLQ